MTDSAQPSTSSAARILAVAWLLLTLAVVAVLISFKTSQAGLLRSLAAYDAPAEGKGRSPSRLDRITEDLNVAAGGSLVYGLICLAWYALLNL